MSPVRAVVGVALLLVAAAGCSTSSTPDRSGPSEPGTSAVAPEVAAIATTAPPSPVASPTERVEPPVRRSVRDQRTVTDEVRGFDGEVLPTHVTVEDGRDDVVRNGEPDGKGRSGDLDIWSVSGAWVGTDLVLQLRVKDLRPEHLREGVHDGVRSVATHLVAAAQLPRGDSLGVAFGTDGTPTVSHYYPRALNGPGSDVAKIQCLDETHPGRSRFEQAADDGRNTITFTLPITCLPDGDAWARVSGSTSWSRGEPGHGVELSDSLQRVSGGSEQSEWFRFQ